MSRNLAALNEKAHQVGMKRLRKANKLAKAIAHGGFGIAARDAYVEKYPEAKDR